MKKPLLIEIGVEELPAEPLLKELKNIEKKWKAVLEEFNLVTEFSFFYTPRRFVLWHREFLQKQPDQEREMFGPPVAIAFKDGEPTRACESFAKKCGVEISQLSRSEKNGKEVLYYSYTEEGHPLYNILEEMVLKFLISLNFGKSMRWASGEYNFIRPVHSVVSMLGSENIPINIFGVESKLESFGHRSADNPIIHLTHTGDYFCNLPKQGVMVKPKERELTILNQFEKLESAENIKIEIDEGLLHEVVAITEEPTSLLGSFDDKFLELPDEVIVTSMREHQRYFPVYKDGELTNRFVVVSNALTDDFSNVVAGNERVLRARLSDALFFYHNDLKNGLVADGLQKLVFVEGLGTMADKINREEVIAKYLAEQYKISELDVVERSVQFSKRDLMTEMVYEFTELQGLMGSYYADKLGENGEVVTALREQYLPDGESGEVPSTKISAVVAMSYKLDLLFGLFSIKHIPTGSRDPFGLRRAVNGVIRTALAHNFPFNIDDVFEALKDNYSEFEFAKLREFFFERVLHFYKDINPSVVKSVLSVESEILEIDKKVVAISEIVKDSNFEERLSTFKRVTNIIKDVELSSLSALNESILIESAEVELYSEFKRVRSLEFDNYQIKLETLFGLKPLLDSFFDSVMVNVDDSSVKENRQTLMGEIYREFTTVSDIKEITVR